MSDESGVLRRMSGRRSQAGFSLVEVLICVMLVSIVILGLAAGMLTLLRVTKATSERQQIEVALGRFTENLLVSAYIPCAPTPAPSPNVTNYNNVPGRWNPEKPGMTATIIGVEYWNDAQKKFASTCPPGLDQGTQRLKVQVEWRGRTGTAQIVKSYRPGPTP